MSNHLILLLSSLGVLVLLGIAAVALLASGVHPKKGTEGASREPHRGTPPDVPGGKLGKPHAATQRSLLGVLDGILQELYQVSGTVRPGYLVSTKPGLSTSEWQPVRDPIGIRHRACVVCDPRDPSAQFVVELDDSNCGKAKRRGKGGSADHVSAAAGMPIFDIPAQHAGSVLRAQSRLLRAAEPTMQR